MGQKVNPHGLRVGVIKNWDSNLGTGGCSTSPPLCGCVLNISEGKEKCAYHQTRYILGDVDHSNAA